MITLGVVVRKIRATRNFKEYTDKTRTLVRIVEAMIMAIPKWIEIYKDKSLAGDSGTETFPLKRN